jgi:hypothetical protein
MTPAEAAIVEAGCKANHLPSATLAELRHKAAQEGRETLVSIKEIYNARQKFFSNAATGKTRTDALIKQLDSAGIPFEPCFGAANVLTHLFVTEPMAMTLARHYGQLLFIDCTYKTNKYNMPMLHIVAATASNTTFTVAFAFMSREREKDYIWAMKCFKRFLGNTPVETVMTDAEMALRNAIEQEFPRWKHILCLWHIQQNIVKNCKKGIPNDTFIEVLRAWWGVVRQPTEAKFKNAKVDLIHRFGQNGSNTQQMVGYLIIGFEEAERFAFYATGQAFHLNYLATSTGESFHRAVKRQIKGSGDLFAATNAVLNHMESTQLKIFDIHANGPVRRNISLPECFVQVS